MARDDQFERYYAERLWAMIPEVYRYEDARGDNPFVLRQIVEVIAEDVARTRRSVDRLWEDQHVDTADDWAISYLGDLVGTRMLPEIDARGRRVDVARTVHFRRRRGTPGLLESLAKEISGWDVILVEAFRRLARTAHRLDRFPVEVGSQTKTPRAGTARLRSPRARELAGSAFDETFRSPDVRPLRGARGRYNVGKVNFHLFRQIAYTISDFTPARLSDPGPTTFTFDPSGRDIPIFQRGQAPSAGATCGPPWTEASADDSADTQSSSCDPRCGNAREWHVVKPLSSRYYAQVLFQIEESHLALLAALLNESDRLALEQLVGFSIEGEGRLRFLLEQQGISFTPEPSFYRPLLELAVLPESGSARINDPEFGSLLFVEADDPEAVLAFHETTGAHLASRRAHPVPSDAGIQVLVHAELGRFAYPEEQPPLPDDDDPTPKPAPEPEPSPIPGDGSVDSDCDTTDADGDSGDGENGDGGEGGEDDPSDDGDDPPPLELNQILLFSGEGPLTIADRVVIHQGSTPVSFVSASSATTELGVDSRLGNLWSNGDVFFRNRARVTGFVKTNGVITSQEPTADIGDWVHTEQNGNFDFSEFLQLLNFTVTFPPHGDQDYFSGWGELSLAPGSYRRVVVQSGGTLRLVAGTYYFEELILDSSGNLRIDASLGRIFVFVQNQLVHRAVTLLDAGRAADFVLVGMMAWVDLDAWSTHFGVVIVPYGTLSLRQMRSFHGSFFAHRLEALPDQVFFLEPWDGYLPDVEYGSSSFGSSSLSALTAGQFESAVAEVFEVTLTLPVGVALSQISLYASEGPLNLAANLVRNAEGPGLVVGLSSNTVTVGSQAQVGSVWSGGAVHVLDRGLVEGSVTATGLIQNAGTITGAQSSAGLATEVVRAVTVSFAGGPDQAIAGAEPVALDPGEYGAVEVAVGATLVLRGGSYLLQSLVVRPGGRVELDRTADIVLDVKDTLELGGELRTIWGAARQFELRFFGTSVELTKPFSGWLWAPRARVVLSPLQAGHHEGAFFASELDVQGNTVVLAARSSARVLPRRVTWGTSGPIGALPLARLLDPVEQTEAGGGVISLQDQKQSITFEDSHTYRLRVAGEPGSSSYLHVLQAREAARPYVLLEGDGTNVGRLTRAPGDSKRLLLLGVWIGSFHDSRSDLVIDRTVGGVNEAYDWDEVILRQCTLDPGGVRADGSRIAPVRLVIRGTVRRLVIERSVVGAIVVERPQGDLRSSVEELCITDSVVDASNEEPRTQGRRVAIDSNAGSVSLLGTTVLGDVVAEVVTASDSLVSGGLLVVDTQRSCFRFSATSLADLPLEEDGQPRSPRFYQVPPIPRIEPHFFVSLQFGDPGYAQLSEVSPEVLHGAAENGSEVGAFSFLLRRVRWASVLSKVDEFQPVGVLPQFISEGEVPVLSTTLAAE